MSKHRVTAMHSVSKALYEAAIAEKDAEIERLRAALEDIARGYCDDPMWWLVPLKRARAALEGKR